MQITTKEIQDKDRWESFVISKNPKSFLQSWNWGETNRIVGKNIRRIGFYKDSKLHGVALFITEKAKRGKHILVPGGPIIDWTDKSTVNEFVKVIRELGIKEVVAKDQQVPVRAWFFTGITSMLLTIFKSNGILTSCAVRITGRMSRTTIKVAFSFLIDFIVLVYG